MERKLSYIKPVLEEFFKTEKWQGDFENKIKGTMVSFISRYIFNFCKLLSNKELILY